MTLYGRGTVRAGKPVWRWPNVQMVVSGSKYSTASPQSIMLGLYPYVAPSQWTLNAFSADALSAGVEILERNVGFTTMGVAESIGTLSSLGRNSVADTKKPKWSTNRRAFGRNIASCNKIP